MADTGTAHGAAQDAGIAVLDGSPTDPAELRAKRIAQADAAVAAAKAKVERQEAQLKGTKGDKRERLSAHLAGARQALADATAYRKGI